MKRGIFLSLTSVTMVALLQMNKAWALLPAMLMQCEAGLSAENCTELFLKYGYYTASLNGDVLS